jgi:hypothetical protein
MIIASLFLSFGCGGSPAVPPAPTGGTPPGSYTITVSAKSGSITHSTAFTLSVQ